MEVTADAPALWIQLLGEFKVFLRADSEEPQRFRSRTAERLLASLALRLGQSVSKGQIVDVLWPDSDGDRQAQNLRRALSDIRQVLEQDAKTPVIVRSQGDRLWLDPEMVQTDVSLFKQLTNAGLEGEECEQNLRAAIQMYSGSLLSDQEEPWLQVHRMELEERFGQAVELLIKMLLSSENDEEALRIGRRAVIAAPYREDVHMALIGAYASAGLRSEAIRQFEELEALLDEHWGESPSPKSIRAFEALWISPGTAVAKGARPPGIPDSESAGGAVPAGSAFYVTRDCDLILQRAISRSEGTILVHGPRQVGKTSLLYRVLGEARSGKPVVAITDFQLLSRSQLADADTFCRTLAYGFATQLGIKLDLREVWNEWIGPNSNLHAVVESVLKQINGPVVWAMDEADRLFGIEFGDDFFGLVRSWHNLRAMDAGGPFSRFSLVISYATEAHLFIQDINQSPFNVGIRIPMRDFDEGEIRELSLRYGVALPDQDVRRIWTLTGGQPFLARKALDALVHDRVTVEDLVARASEEDGPFGEHLRRLLSVASRDEGTKEEVIRFLRRESFLDPKTPLRLLAGGMLSRREPGKLDFRVPAYRDFLSRYLLGAE